MRKCLTGGMIMHTEIHGETISITIEAPNQKWDEGTAAVIVERLHDGIEYALAPYWQNEGNTAQTTVRCPETVHK